MKIHEPNLSSAYALALAHRLASKADATGFGSDAKGPALQTSATEQGSAFDRALTAVDEGTISYNLGDSSDPAQLKTISQDGNLSNRPVKVEKSQESQSAVPIHVAEKTNAPEAKPAIQVPLANALPQKEAPPAPPTLHQKSESIPKPSDNQLTTAYRPPTLASPPPVPVYANPLQTMPQPNAVSALYQVTQSQQSAVTLTMPKDLPKSPEEIRRKDKEDKEKKTERTNPLNFFL